jgi:AhpD family alkylhydroperoxidase
MTRIPMVDPDQTTGRLRALLDGVAAKRGRVPAMVRVLANAPAALSGYFSFHAALGSGVLHPALREQIAIAVAEANGCDTCLAAHTEFGRQEGLSDGELDAARDGRSMDPATTAALGFAISVMRTVGHVSDAELVA